MKSINSIMIIVLLLINGLLVYQILRNRKAVQPNRGSFETENKIIKSFATIQYSSDLARIPASAKVQDIQKRQFTLKELLAERKFILRIREDNCDVCIDDQMDFLKRYMQQIGEKNVIVLCTYANPRNLQILKNRYQINSTLVNIDSQYLKSIHAEKSGIIAPYVFVSGPELAVSMCFVPEKSMPERSDDYYTAVSKKFK